MKPLHINTPLLESSTISKKTGRQIFLKMEALQPTGSFKIRGIGHLCSELARNGACRFVTSSAGNGGLAVAYAGRKLDIPVTVVVWNTVSEMTREKLRREGAEIIVHGNDWMEANNLAQSMCEEKGVCYVHPFDHTLLWEGHTSLIHEVKAAGIKPDAVVVAVGGGGLLCGVIQGLYEVGWSDVTVFTAETSGAASLAESVKTGKLITLDKIDTIALSLGARRVAEQAFKWTQKHPIIPLVVSDAQAVGAVFQFANDQRILIEPACGAALAVVYDKHSELMKYEKILVIVCGGCNVDLDLLALYLMDYCPKLLMPLKGDHGKKAVICYQGTVDKDIREKLENKANDIVAQNLNFSFRLVGHEELARKTIYLQPGLPKNKPLRLLTLNGVGSVADGGTQVNKTSEVGKISILPLETKEGMTFIHYRLI